MGRRNEMWVCTGDPREVLDIIIAEYCGDTGTFERVTLDNFNELWDNQDRWEFQSKSNKETIKEKIKAQLMDGKPWYWFSVHY